MLQQTNVSETLANLIKLQTVAEEAFILKRDEGILISTLEKQKNKFDNAEEDCMKIEEQVDSINQDITDEKSEIQLLKEEIIKLKAKEKMVKTQKEYIALSTEESLKTDKIKELEKSITNQTKEIDKLQKDLDKKLEDLAVKEKKLNQLKEDTEINLADIKEKLTEIEQVQIEVTPKIDFETLNRYENIVQNKNGVGIVPIIEGICEGCNLMVTPQLLSQIRKKDKIIYCNNCARMLYLP